MMQKLFEKIDGLDSLLNRYDGFIIDLWGVICNRKGPFPYIYEPLKKMKLLGKKVFFLSNSPQRQDAIHKMVQEKLNISRDLYVDLFTSGESIYESFHEGHFLEKYAIGKTCFVIDTIPNEDLLRQLGIIKTPVLENADFVLALDIFEDEDGMKTYYPTLKKALELDLPMVCANIDRRVMSERGDILYKPGELAFRYQNLGGRIFHAFGKPDPYMFKRALKEVSSIDPSKILVIGDGIATDISGANAMNLASVFVMSGVHSHEFDESSDESLMHFFKDYKTHPTFCVSKFVL